MTNPAFPEPGIHLDVPSDVYHGDDTAVSRSQLAKLVTGMPSDLYYSLSNQSSPTKGMLTGSLTDDLFYLGVDHVSKNYLIRPEGMKLTTKAGKAWKAGYEGDPRAQVTYDQWTAARGMCAALRASPLAMEYLGSKHDPAVMHQSSHVRVNPETGVKEKCRPDTLLTSRGICVDLKTTAPKNLGRMEWTRYCENYRLELQPGMYLPIVSETTGTTFDRWIWVVVSNVETDGSHRVECYEASQAAIEKGRADILAAQTLYAACKDSGKWPTSSGQLQQIEYRPWALA